MSEFLAPAWLRNLGFSSWLLVGFVLIILGVIWLLDQTSTIVMPVIFAAVLGAVAGPGVGWLERHRVPRIGGAIIVLLGLVAIGVVIFLLVVGGISANSGDISAKLNKSLDKIQGWLDNLGVEKTQQVKEDVQKAAPEIRKTLLGGVANGISGLKSTLFFLAFATLSTVFVLKDGPVMARFINRHMGVPERDAAVVTKNVAGSLRNYFLGVTIIAAFNAVVIGGAALIIGVPLAGTIAVVTAITAYIPYIGAFVSGAFAVLIALGAEGTTKALIMLVIVLLANGLLQNIFQPFAMGSALHLHPLAVLILTIGAGCIFGMIGLVLAAPLTSAAVHITQELRQAKAAAGLQDAAHAPPA